MKKMICLMLACTMMFAAVGAIAENDTNNTGSQPAQRQEMRGGPQQGRGPQMNGQNGMKGPGPRGQMADGQKPADAPELHNGEKPADAPELPSSENATDKSQLPNGEKPADAPELPSSENATDKPELPNGEKPADMNGQTPAAPGMVDFDAAVTNGVISQETRDKIKTYMDEHKPEGSAPDVNGEKPADAPEKPEGEMPTDGEKPADAPELPSGEKPADQTGGDLLSDLLKAGIITQAEYDALVGTNTATTE